MQNNFPVFIWVIANVDYFQNKTNKMSGFTWTTYKKNLPSTDIFRLFEWINFFSLPDGIRFLLLLQ